MRVDREDRRNHGIYTFLLNHPPGMLGLAAQVAGPKTGRRLEVLTTESALEFDDSSALDSLLRSKGGTAYRDHAGFCLATRLQFNSPDGILNPGERYLSTTVWQITAR